MKKPLVLFETMFELYFDGWCEAARAYALAMEVAGIDVRLKSWRDQSNDEPIHPEVLAQVGHLMRPCEKQWDAYIWSGGFYGPLEGAAPRLTAVRKIREQFGKPVAFYSMFERTNVQPRLVPLLNALNSVMVPCSSNQRALEKAGLQNSIFIPLPFFSNDKHLGLRPPSSPPRVFYWIGRWEPRKAPHRLIRAFLQAFEPGEAELVMKVGPAPWVQSPYLTPDYVVDKSIAELGGKWSRDEVDACVKIVREKYSPEEMLALHDRGDVYCSASHGEGIDMPAFAAKLAGRRIVTTACGGPLDFVDETDIVIPARGEISIPAYDRTWGQGSTAIDYDFEDLVKGMRLARHGKPTRRRIAEHHVEIVAPFLKQWIEGML